MSARANSESAPSVTLRLSIRCLVLAFSSALQAPHKPHSSLVGDHYLAEDAALARLSPTYQVLRPGDSGADSYSKRPQIKPSDRWSQLLLSGPCEYPVSSASSDSASGNTLTRPPKRPDRAWAEETHPPLSFWLSLTARPPVYSFSCNFQPTWSAQYSALCFFFLPLSLP